MKASAPSSGGGGLLELGNYHGIIDAYEVVSYKEQKTNPKTKETIETEHFGLQLTVTTLAAADESQVGKTLQYQNFYHDRLYSLAAAIGLKDLATGRNFDHQQHVTLADDIEAGRRPVPEFDETEATARQFCFDVVMGKPKKSGKNEGKSFPEIGKQIFSPYAPEAKDFPKDLEMLGEVSDAQETVPPGGDELSEEDKMLQ